MGQKLSRAEIEARRETIIRDIQRVKRAYEKRVGPMVEELVRLKDAEGPAPVVLDGRTFIYTGPLPEIDANEDKV